MTGRQIRRLLYGLLILALFVIVLHSGRTAYWLAKDGYYSPEPSAQRFHAEVQADYGEQQVVKKLRSGFLHLDPNRLNVPTEFFPRYRCAFIVPAEFPN